jgi:NADH-quinone oxidoreductase subunit L
MPVTFWTFAIATLAIAGFPLTAGFFSKDEILWSAWSAGHPLIWGLLSFTALLTAFYMGRLTWLVFFGSFRGSTEAWQHVHESPASMTVPLSILALLSLAGGFVGMPAVFGAPNLFHDWLAPALTPLASHGAHAAEAHHDAGTEWFLIGIATAIGVAGLAAAWAVYRREGVAERWAARFGPLYTTLRNLWWVDELYEAYLVRPFYAACRFFRGVDRWVIDGLVNASGVTAELTGQVIKLFQTGLVRNYALVFLLGAVAILYYFMTV